MAKTQILLLGSTGFIGGTILNQLLEHPNRDSFKITVLVRSAEKAKKLDDFELGLNVVVGSTEDSALLEKLASEADVVIAASPAEDPKMVNTILPGLKKRYNETQVPARFMTVGGMSILGDGAGGMHSTDKIYSDITDSALLLDPPRPEMKPYKFLAEALVNADSEGYVKTYMLNPPLVYGWVDNRLVDAGIQNGHCWVWSLLIKPALARSQPGYIGQGKNIIGCVHVYDLAALFILVLDSEMTAPHGKDGIYFANPSEITWKELVEVIGDSLVNLGKLDSSTPKGYTEEELSKYFPPFVPFALGNNVRAISERSYSIGWKPRYGKDALLENARAETERIALAQQ